MFATAVKDLENSPFHLHNSEGYRLWRERKLTNRAPFAEAVRVEVANPARLSDKERELLTRTIGQNNLAIYASGCTVDKTVLRQFGQQLGLQHLDGNLCADEDSITSLQVVDEGRHAGYIPYSNRPLSWHTDGYYNDGSHQIRAILMHCVQDAESGGDNRFLDHEILYLLLRDEDPEMIAALMQADAMTIPGNQEGDKEIRGAETGPVFSLDGHGNLHMRYSARQRNIIWKDEPLVMKAKERITELLQEADDYILSYRLKPGEGVICNNVLHNRSGFTDNAANGKQRLLYRARYYDRVANTDIRI